MGSFLILAFIFLCAGVMAVPLASRLGLGSVLGYLIAGIVISPILSALNVDVISIQHFAEFGVVMMLFIVGLELEPKALWAMRHKLLGLGGLQVAGTAAAIMAVCMMFGLSWQISLAIGLVLCVSSTAIVVQTLTEKAQMQSPGGKAAFSVLLFQDMAVIPMLALIPLLASPELVAILSEAASHAEGEASHSISLVEGLKGWQTALLNLGAIAAVIIVGSLLTRPLFRYISIAGMRELFVATALMMVVGIALLMTLVGLSPALGTFLAGVVLAGSEYRHELESDIDPFKGMLLGLFFMTVGAAINFELLFAELGLIVALSLGLIAIKALVLLILSFIFKVQFADRWLFSLGLAQAGEFGFVLVSLTVINGVIPQAVADKLLLVVALSMLLTPALFIIFEKLIKPRFDIQIEREDDDIDMQSKVIIAGHGRVGGVVSQIMRGIGIQATVLDYSAKQLEILRTFDVKAYYGDASRADLLHAAGIAQAKVLVVAIDQKDPAIELVRHVHENYPHVHIVARAFDRFHVYDLYAAGAHDIIRETFDSSVRMGRSALEALNVHPYDAEREVREFVIEDRHNLVETASLYDPELPFAENHAFVEKVKEILAKDEEAINGGLARFARRADRGWKRH